MQCLFEPELYEATSGDWIRTLQPLTAKHHHILLGGHNPGLSDLVSGWTGRTFDLIPGQVVGLEFNDPQDIVASGKCKLIFDLHD